MKLFHVNIARGLLSKFDVIREHISENEIDIAGLTEVDLKVSEDSYPEINGYDTVIHNNEHGISRIGLYIRNGIKYKTISRTELPGIVIRLNQMDILYLYSQFTASPYSVNRHYMTEKERTNILMDTLDWFDSIAKRNAMVFGDINCDWFLNSVSKRRIEVWAKDTKFKQII